MKPLVELFPLIEDKIVAPVCVATGPVWPVAKFCHRIGGAPVCFQMDLVQAARLDEGLREVGSPATVAAYPDLWDLPTKFKTVVLPALYDADRELKIDLIEQAWHVLEPGGKFVVVSEHFKDSLFAKQLKKIFGKCSMAPASKAGSVFWATKVDDGPRDRRRHEVSFHAKVGDFPSLNIVTRPGLFSYGEFDKGSRAMLEVAELKAGDRVLDMGSGCGAVGCLAAQRIQPGGSVTFVDSHLRALALSELNAKANGVTNFRVHGATHFEGLQAGSFDVALANPPYYANADIARLFVDAARGLLAPGGRFFFVTKMPTATVGEIFDAFGDCSVIENRGYSVVLAEKT
jgi:16S rRNA (guanine1207-N2)-methyltransferase